MKKNNQNIKTYLVIGGSRGIGLSTVELLIAEGSVIRTPSIKITV